METKKSLSSIIVNVIFGLLMVAVLVCQFLPFWTVADQSASLLDVSARQYEERLVVINGLDEALNGFTHHDINWQVLLTIVCAALGAFVAFSSRNAYIELLTSLACLGFGLWLFLAVPAYSLGIMCYVILALEAVGVVGGILSLVTALKDKNKA